MSITVRQKKIRKNHTTEKLIIFVILALVLVIIAALSMKIAPYDPYAQDLNSAMQPPSTAHLMGTDEFGRDMFSRVLVGGRISIFATLALVLSICFFGTILGTICGYVGGPLDTVIMRISDFCLAFPGLVFALGIAALLGGGIVNASLALAVISWPKFARLARSSTMTLRDSDYVRAAKMAQCCGFQIVVRHILPNILGPVVVTAVLDIGTMMMELAGLSFLGLGAQPPAAEWGNMMSNGRSMLQIYPWVVLSPGAAIFITVVIFNLLGDSLRDYMDPANTMSTGKKTLKQIFCRK